MPSAVIQPAADKNSRRHFEDTIRSPVALDRLRPHVTPDDLLRLGELYGARGVPTWGATPGKTGLNIPKWERLARGDVVCFMRDHHVFATGVVTHKLRSASLARALWTRKPDGQVFEYVFFLDDVLPAAVHYDVIREAAGFEGGWNPLGFAVISDARADRIIRAVRSGAPTAPSGAQDPQGIEQPLELVRTVADIRAAVLAFNAQADPRVRTALTGTDYWVFDPQLDAFAPSKFAGLRSASVDAYTEAQREQLLVGRVPRFDGTRSRLAIERALGASFEASLELSERLQDWAQALLGDDVLGAVRRDTWRFVTLPAATRSSSAPRSRNPEGRAGRDLEAAIATVQAAGEFDAPADDADGRRRVLVEIARRRGQPRFRRMLMAAYGARCAMSGCDVAQALEAAHILPYRGEATNHPANGMLLRADLHTLFDLGLLVVDPATLRVVVSPALRATSYNAYDGRALTLPEDSQLQPNREALRRHRLAAGF